MELKIDFFELLTLAFIVLKLVGVIEWSWILVLCPCWIKGLLIILLAIFATFL